MISNEDMQRMEGLKEWLDAVPYDVTRNRLYSAADLYEGYEPSTALPVVGQEHQQCHRVAGADAS